MKPAVHHWEFKARFRRHAFGWRSQPAIQRIKQAVSEIKKTARTDPVVAADGAVLFLARLSPALEQVDGSSGAIGTAVNHAVDDLVPIIAAAPADERIRRAWLDRLWAALQDDQIPYIESLGDYWGELCASEALASAWADELISTTRMALSPDRGLHGYFCGASACLSALFYARRFDEILEITQAETFWPYRRWAVMALAEMGKKPDAIQLAESSRGPWTPDTSVDMLCEEILLSSGRIEEAYQRYGLYANRKPTYLATFRAVAAKYPHKDALKVLTDLVETTPGDEGKWFAAAKDAGLYEEALALAGKSPCDPRTLTRAARDLGEQHPAFAVGAGLLALKWLIHGYGYEITGIDVLAAYACTIAAAERAGNVAEIRDRIAKLLSEDEPAGFARTVLERELELNGSAPARAERGPFTTP